jgi:hypothetical protein
VKHSEETTALGATVMPWQCATVGRPRSTKKKSTSYCARFAQRRFIAQTTMISWKVNILDILEYGYPAHKLSQVIFHQLERHRQGHQIDYLSIKTTIMSLVSLSVLPPPPLKRDNAQIPSPSNEPKKYVQDVYMERFEVLFLQHSKQYYMAFAQSVASSSSVDEYMCKATDALKREEDLIERCLYVKRRKELIAPCEQYLVQEYALTEMVNRFDHLLNTG